MLIPAVPPRTPLPQATREDKLLSSPVTKSLVLKPFYRLCKSAGSYLSIKRACAWGVAVGTELAIHICRPWTIDQFNLPPPLQNLSLLGTLSGFHKPRPSGQSSFTWVKWSAILASPSEPNIVSMDA